MLDAREGDGIVGRTVRLVLDSTVGTLIVLAHVIIAERQAQRSVTASQRGRDRKHDDHHREQ